VASLLTELLLPANVGGGDGRRIGEGLLAAAPARLLTDLRFSVQASWACCPLGT
jgi:hypothetical protein